MITENKKLSIVMSTTARISIFFKFVSESESKGAEFFFGEVQQLRNCDEVVFYREGVHLRMWIVEVVGFLLVDFL